MSDDLTSDTASVVAPSAVAPGDDGIVVDSSMPGSHGPMALGEDYPEEVEVLTVGERRIVLVGTAHISQHSVDLVRQVIERERPDVVCVELDPQRYETLTQRKKWESLDLKQVIRKKQLSTLLANLVLASYQKKLGGQLGIEPGAELLEAAKVAKQYDIPLVLADRDVRATLRRAGAATSLWRKMLLMSELMAGMIESPEISEEQLQELKQKDALSELMEGLGQRYPSLKKVLIDERDAYLKEKIHRSEGDKVVAVVGAGHLQGICRALNSDEPVDLEALEVIPSPSPWWKVVAWAIPLLILSSIVYLGATRGADVAGQGLLAWFLANSIPTAIGALLAGGHPLTILAGGLAAPFTSLSPVVGAHYVTAFVQVYMRPPVVKEFKTVSEDLGTFSKWWQNKLLRVFLCFLLPGLGSVIGTFVGAGKIATLF